MAKQHTTSAEGAHGMKAWKENAAFFRRDTFV
jgi:hypothetical protein